MSIRSHALSIQACPAALDETVSGSVEWHYLAALHTHIGFEATDVMVSGAIGS